MIFFLKLFIKTLLLNEGKATSMIKWLKKRPRIETKNLKAQLRRRRSRRRETRETRETLETRGKDPPTLPTRLKETTNTIRGPDPEFPTLTWRNPHAETHL